MNPSIQENGERIAKLEADNVNLKMLLIDLKNVLNEGFERLRIELKTEYKEDLSIMREQLKKSEADIMKLIEAHTKQLEELFIITFFTKHPKIVIFIVLGMIGFYLLNFPAVQSLLFKLI